MMGASVDDTCADTTHGEGKQNGEEPRLLANQTPDDKSPTENDKENSRLLSGRTSGSTGFPTSERTRFPTSGSTSLLVEGMSCYNSQQRGVARSSSAGENRRILSDFPRRSERLRQSRPPRLSLRTLTSELLRMRTTSSMWNSDELDPFQVFEVEHEACLDFQITIHRGEGITKGSLLQDYIDTPDPYVILKIPGSSNSSKRTTQLDNTTVPLWEETFHFYLDPVTEHTLSVTLMDANITLDEILGEDTYCVNTLTNDVPVKHTFSFLGGAKVHATLLLTKNKDPDLRFSLALCEKEREFLQIRRQKILLGMHKLLGAEDAPVTDKQVPIMAVLGSGGGFRALICLSGAVKALYETGVFDCATYISGLSGSSWYISTLYSHESFPKLTPVTIRDELRESVTAGWKWKLTNSLTYVSSMLRKYREGQPISFTDFFGHLLGDVLLKGRKNSCKLTDQRNILSQGTVPFPLYTCLHAKRSVSCRAFSEWVEFSPYEIGIAKYGTFMKTEHFGSKFMVGKLIKQHPESPLHFLQGVWGSAFTVLIKRLVLKGSNNKDMVQIMRENSGVSERDLTDKYDDALVEQISESDTEDEDDIIGNDDIDLEEPSEDATDAVAAEDMENLDVNDKDDATSAKGPQRKISAGNRLNPINLIANNKSQSADATPKKPFSFEFPFRKKAKENQKKISTESAPGDLSCVPCVANSSVEPHKLQRQGAIKGPVLSTALSRRESRLTDVVRVVTQAKSSTQKWAEKRRTKRAKREQTKTCGLMGGLKDSLLANTNVFNSRAGRAGEILNPFRGLSLKNSFPISPFAISLDDEEEADEVDCDDVTIGAGCRYQHLDNTAKKLFIVDSGLAFNSPYPLLLRPQRAVDIYLSFDFSMRKTDNTLPFKELILAERWASQNKVPFPPVEKQIEQYKEEGFVREVYVFKNKEDPFCPVILHFPLVNYNFRRFKSPGTLRTTDEEIEFADFKIFDDKTNVYSSTNFVYENIQFERMSQLAEFNTLFCLDTIKAELAEAVKRKKDNIAKRELGISDVASLLTRVKTVRSSQRNTGLRLSIAPDRENKLLTMLKYHEKLNGTDQEGSSDTEDYADAMEYQE